MTTNPVVAPGTHDDLGDATAKLGGAALPDLTASARDGLSPVEVHA